MTPGANPSAATQKLFQEAEAALRATDFSGAAALFERCLAQAPQFRPARQQLAMLLQQQLSDPKAALAQIEILLADEPDNAAYLAFRAASFAQTGDYPAALAANEEALRKSPGDARGLLRYGQLLKAVGRTADAVAAYRKSLSLQPSGEGWWSLADLRTERFSSADRAAMRSLLQFPGLAPHERAALHFALGKALEDEREFEAAFRQFDLGNAMKRAQPGYDARENTAFVARCLSFLTPEFFAYRNGSGVDAPDPIFIVGTPRSGSTLVEQILASHSAIEGTGELSDLPVVARKTLGNGPPDFRAYPMALANVNADGLRALGLEYLVRTRVYRRLGRPLFVDRMPNNFVHAGLIHLILPNAKIVDVRRHPLASCLSAFKQNFAAGAPFSYELTDLGRYYADYVRLMAHFDAVLPGRIHRVFYEDLVAEPEREVRRLLAYCGVPFEDATLRFDENRRPVRGASSEQVRRPLYRDGLDNWRPFEPWLGPLKTALGPTLNAYPKVPLAIS